MKIKCKYKALITICFLWINMILIKANNNGKGLALIKRNYLSKRGDSFSSSSNISTSNSSSTSSSSNVSTSNSSSTSTSSGSPGSPGSSDQLTDFFDNNIKKAKPPERQKTDEELYWEQFYSKKRGEKCKAHDLLKSVKSELSQLNIKLTKEGQNLGNSNSFYWIKAWGFGLTAYLFDFLDVIFGENVIKQFSLIWEHFVKMEKVDSNYKDPFALDQKFDDLSEKELKNMENKILELKENAKKVGEIIYQNSINAVQLHNGLKGIDWKQDSAIGDNSISFIRSYDINGDGRLSPRELILGSIYQNKGILGSDICKLCYDDIIDQIDAIFGYMDCSNSGAISSLDIYENFPKLTRMTSKHNFFILIKQAPMRTAVINEFILKNGYEIRGKLTKTEFRIGILLGFWDRQTDDYGIIKDDKRNLKKLRWDDEGIVDLLAMESIKNREIEKRQRKLEEESNRKQANAKV